MSRDNSGWKLVEISPVASYFGRKVEYWGVRRANDPNSQTDRYLMLGERDYIIVAGVTHENKIVLIEEDKVAEGRSLQLIAGRVEDGEGPLETARREFVEESPWHAKQIVPLTSSVQRTDIGFSLTTGNNGAKRCYMFLAMELEPSSQQLEESEIITSHLVPLDIAHWCARTGQPVPEIGLPIEDISSCLCIIRAAHMLKEI